LGPMLAIWPNVSYYQCLMAGLRGAIRVRTLREYARRFAETFALGDIDPMSRVRLAIPWFP
jgi:hypothetical protein